MGPRAWLSGVERFNNSGTNESLWRNSNTGDVRADLSTTGNTNRPPSSSTGAGMAGQRVSARREQAACFNPTKAVSASILYPDD
jgi:hypothetical protein